MPHQKVGAMLIHRFNHRVLPMLAAEESGGGGGEAEKPETPSDDLDKVEGLGDKGKEVIRKEREAAKAAADEAKAAKAERDALLKEKAEREAAESKAREEEAARKGEFETLAQKREAERDAAKAEAKTLADENTELKAAMAEGITSGWKDLPDEVRKIGEKQHAEDDVLGRFRFLNDPDTKALVAKLTGSTEGKAAHGRDPRATGSSKPELKSLISKAQYLG